MPKSSEQKKKALIILQYLWEKSDEDHPLPTTAIIDYLENMGIKAERKSIYSDIEMLCSLGYDIIYRKGQYGGYYMASRDFAMAELKLLVDAVQSSKFITEKKSNELISKIEKLTSHYEGRKLQRQVYVANRVKTDNESILYNIDGIHEAISGNYTISFLYSEWNMQKKLVYRNNGERYIADPLNLVWDDENYYLVAVEISSGITKHYRVDKMSDIVVEPTRRKVSGYKYNTAEYTKEHFSMFHGKKEIVTVRFTSNLIGVVIDRFGKDVSIIPRGDSHFDARLEVQVSNQFFGWITGLAPNADIIAPEPVVKQYKGLIEDIIKRYE